jgi:conjugal transfer ATP-binding protein TraC
MVVGSGTGPSSVRSDALYSLWPDAAEVFADAIRLDDHWVRAFVPHGWPREVRTGWLLPLFQLPFAHTLAVTVDPLPSEDQLARLTRQLVWNLGAREARQAQGRLEGATTAAAVSDAARLREDMALGEARMARIGLALAIRAPTRAQLDQRSRIAQSIAAGLMLPLRPSRFRQRQNWLATLPGLWPQEGTREMDTRAAATVVPLLGDGLQHPGGEVWGVNPTTRAPIVLDRYALPAPHSLTLAWSGAGKSFATKLAILRARYHAVPVVVLDPEGEYRGLAGGQGVIRMGRGVGLNPLKLFADDAGDVLRRADFAARWVEAVQGPLAPAERVAVQQHLGARGHLDPREWANELQRDASARFPTTLAALARWNAVMGDGDTPIPAGGLTVVDLSAVPADLKTAAYLVAVEHVLATLPGAQRRWVVFDEAWLLLGNPVLAPYLEQLYRRARKWGTALCLVTQDAQDTLRSVAAQVCLRNSPTVLLLRPHPEALGDLSRIFRLTPPEVDLLASADRGEGLLLADRFRLPIRVEASPAEARLIREAEHRVA